MLDIINLLLIAFGLSVDSFHIALAAGAFFYNLARLDRIKLATAFFIFHFIMMFAGWLFGHNIVGYIETFAHWLVLLLLGFIGIKFIMEAVKNEDEATIKENFFSLKNIIFLGLVTSLDALAVGFSFALGNKDIFVPTIVICIVVGFMTLLGLQLGNKLSHKFKTNILKVFAGIVLILIGVYPILEHYILQ